MATTNFIDGQTPILASWLNWIDGRAGEMPLVSDSGSLAAAIAAGGPLVFGAGSTAITDNVTIPSTAYFLPGAYLTISAGKVVTFDGYVEAPRQQIFAGAGTVLLNGERSHSVMPEWWGAFPGVTAGVAAQLQKISDSVVTGRECLVWFACGTYYLEAGVEWSRAMRLMGAGQRLTHFRCTTSFQSGDVFTVSGEGCEFLDMHFTTAPNGFQRTSGAYIRLDYPLCAVERIRPQNGFVAVEVRASGCNVRDVRAIGPWATGAGSAIISLTGGCSYAVVENIEATNPASGFAPEYAVRIDVATNFMVFGVKDVNSSLAAVGVCPTTNNVIRGQIRDIISGTPRGVYLYNTNVGVIDNIEISGVSSTGASIAAIELRKDASQRLSYIGIEGIHANTGAVGVKVSSSSAFVDHLRISDGIVRQGSGNGIDIANARWFRVTGMEVYQQGGTGILIAAGCATLVVTDNLVISNTVAQITDNSGAVSKVVADNLTA